MMRALRVGLVLAACGGLAAAGAPPVKLVAHRAQYEMTLAPGNSPGGIAGVNGLMVVEFKNACDGFTTTERFVADMSDADQNSRRTDFGAETWESADGRKFRFNTWNAINGKTMDHYQGSADANAGAGGHAIYELPRSRTLDLPAGTLFPTEFLRALIAAARAGQNTFSQMLFEGDDPAEFYEASAFIGAEDKAPDADANNNTLVADVRSWPVAVSYYRKGANDGVAEYQISFRLYENGVSTGIAMSYPEFALRGRLVKLESLPSGC